MYSFWEHQRFFAQQDVIIVGAGFTGLSCGISLLKNAPHLKVTILEQRPLGALASSKNAGFLCFGSPSELSADLIRYNEAAVVSLLRQKLKGISLLLAYTKGYDISYKARHGYELLLDAYPQAQSEAQIAIPKLNALFQEAFGIQYYYKDPTQYTFGNRAHQAIQFRYEGQIDPAQTVTALSRKFQNLGGNILYNYQVNDLQIDAATVRLDTSLGHFQTQQLLLATNALTAKLSPAVEIQPQRAQVMVTAPLPNLPYIGNFHADFGYLYFRNLGNRLLIGGARNVDFKTENTDALAQNQVITQQLTDFCTQQLFNEQFSIEGAFHWSGIMGFREQGHPTVERLSERSWMAAGLNGMGAALGPYLGFEAAKQMLTARDAKYAKMRALGKMPAQLQSK